MTSKKKPEPVAQPVKEPKEPTELEVIQAEMITITRELLGLKNTNPKQFFEKKKRLTWLAEQRDSKS